VAIKVNLLPREARAARTGRAAVAVPRAAGVSPGLLPQILIGVLVVMLLGMSFLGYQAWSAKRGFQSEITTLKAKNEDLKGQLNELNQAEKAKIEIQRRIEVIGKVAKSQGVPLAMLNGVLKAVPQGVWLYGVEMKPQEIRVAVTETQAPVGDTLGRLEAKRTEVEAQAPRPAQRGPGQGVREVSQLAGFSVVIKGGAFTNFQLADFMDNLKKVGIFSDVDFVVTEAERVEQTRVVSFEVTANVKL